MKKSLHITAIIDQPDFLEDIVEKLALRHTAIEYNDQRLSGNRDTLETSSTETYVSGTMVIEERDEKMNVPFITPFLFTCIKLSEDTYSLEWGISLS